LEQKVEFFVKIKKYQEHQKSNPALVLERRNLTEIRWKWNYHHHQMF